MFWRPLVCRKHYGIFIHKPVWNVSEVHDFLSAEVGAQKLFWLRCTHGLTREFKSLPDQATAIYICHRRVLNLGCGDQRGTLTSVLNKDSHVGTVVNLKCLHYQAYQH